MRRQGDRDDRLSSSATRKRSPRQYSTELRAPIASDALLARQAFVSRTCCVFTVSFKPRKMSVASEQRYRSLFSRLSVISSCKLPENFEERDRRVEKLCRRSRELR